MAIIVWQHTDTHTYRHHSVWYLWRTTRFDRNKANNNRQKKTLCFSDEARNQLNVHLFKSFFFFLLISCNWTKLCAFVLNEVRSSQFHNIKSLSQCEWMEIWWFMRTPRSFTPFSAKVWNKNKKNRSTFDMPNFINFIFMNDIMNSSPSPVNFSLPRILEACAWRQWIQRDSFNNSIRQLQVFPQLLFSLFLSLYSKWRCDDLSKKNHLEVETYGNLCRIHHLQAVIYGNFYWIFSRPVFDWFD